MTSLRAPCYSSQLENHTFLKKKVESFIENINKDKADPNIEFTATISDTQVDFLDTTVKIDENGKIYTTLYTKPTDTHNYLLYNSAHPKHCKDATPFSQLLRVRKICREDIDFAKNAEEILGHFHRRGYPLEILKSAWNTVKQLDRDTLLVEKPQTESVPTENSFFLTTTYNPASPNLKGLLAKNWDLVGLPPNNLNIDLKQVKKGYRRCPNLKDKLCRATVEWPKDQTPQGRTHWDPEKAPYDCTKGAKCQTCPLIVRNGRIVSHITGRTYHAPIGVNCESNNLIYLITCKKTNCKAQYVGKTYRELGSRMYEHLYAIRKNRPTSVGQHFNLPGHSIKDVQVEVISLVNIRRLVEKKWIHKLKTSREPGLNVQD